MLGGAAGVSVAQQPEPQRGDWVIKDFRFQPAKSCPS